MKRDLSWRPSFSVMGLLVLSSLVCLYLGLRFYIHRSLPYSAFAISVAMALVICAFSRGETPLERASSLRRCISYATLGAALVGAIIGTDFAATIRREIGHWEWWEFWTSFLLWTSLHGAIGGGTATVVRRVYVRRRKASRE